MRLHDDEESRAGARLRNDEEPPGGRLLNLRVLL
jgi:hypothetical protein